MAFGALYHHIWVPVLSGEHIAHLQEKMVSVVEHDRPPTPNDKNEDNQHQSSYIHVFTFWSLLYPKDPSTNIRRTLGFYTNDYEFWLGPSTRYLSAWTHRARVARVPLDGPPGGRPEFAERPPQSAASRRIRPTFAKPGAGSP